MKQTRSISLALILSLVFHGIVGLFLLLQPNVVKDLTKKDKSVEVELMDPDQLAEAFKRPQQVEDPNRGQIVEQNEKRLNDEIDKNARFLSRHNQKVVREEQAQLHGKFKNSDNSGGKKAEDQKVGKAAEITGAEQKAPEEVSKTEEEREIFTSAEGVATKGKKPKLKDLMPSFKPGVPRVETEQVAQGGGEGSSATDDHLKNVRTGMQTLLSTREFVYYTYYNRIKDKLRQYWEPKIKEKMERIVRQGRSIASDSDRITRIVITLDENGILKRVQVIGPSGLNDLDEAAIEAFRAAAPFPNPPKGIVEADGTIKIRWDFVLEANAGGSLFDAMGNTFKTM